MIITIDGPAAAGKTSSAKALADALGYLYIDTGALYRAVALYMTENNIALENAPDAMPYIHIELFRGETHLNHKNVSDLIRTPKISDMASKVSAIPEVRDALLGLQIQMANDQDIVIEGRDTGSVIFPHADVKFYLTADLLARAERRYQDEAAKGHKPDPIGIARDLNNRDYRDMHRNTAPLVQPAGAVRIDNTNMSLKQTVDFMLAIVRFDRNGK